MESKSFVKLLRKIIREEVSRAVKQVLTESNTNQVTDNISLTEMSAEPMPRRSHTKKKYTKNPMLNDLLNETAATPATQELTDYSTMNFRSEMAEAFGMQRGPRALATTDVHGKPINMSNEKVAKTVDLMTKDYSALMKAIDKKKGK